MSTAIRFKRAGTPWRDFLAGLAGPTAVWEAESAQSGRRLQPLINAARRHVLELDTLYAIDATAGDREIDAALESAESRRHQLRNVFTAMDALAGGQSTGRPHVAELRRLIARVVELAPAAVADSDSFRRLAEAVEQLADAAK